MRIEPLSCLTKVVSRSLILVLLLSAVLTRADDEHWRHPQNARAAASCAHAFLDAGDLKQARFFATLAQEEDLGDPDATFALARLEMKRGLRVDSSLQDVIKRHPGKKKEAARVLLGGARDLLASRSAQPFFDAKLALHYAMQFDPSIRPEARRWTFAVVRNELTPRTAFDIALLLFSVADRSNDPEVGRLIVDIAQRALALKQRHIAGLYLVNGGLLKSPERPRIACLLVVTARALLTEDRIAASHSITAALHIDPTLRNDEEAMWLVQASASCGRTALLRDHVKRFPNGRRVAQAKQLLLRKHAECPPYRLPVGCGMGRSPFARKAVASDVRFFDPVPLPPLAPVKRRPVFLAQCARSLRRFSPKHSTAGASAAPRKKRFSIPISTRKSMNASDAASWSRGTRS